MHWKELSKFWARREVLSAILGEENSSTVREWWLQAGRRGRRKEWSKTRCDLSVSFSFSLTQHFDFWIFWRNSLKNTGSINTGFMVLFYGAHGHSSDKLLFSTVLTFFFFSKLVKIPISIHSSRNFLGADIHFIMEIKCPPGTHHLNGRARMPTLPFSSQIFFFFSF